MQRVEKCPRFYHKILDRGWCIKNATGQNTLKKIDIFLSFWVAIGHKSNISLDLHTIGHLNTFLGAKYPCVSKLSNIL